MLLFLLFEARFTHSFFFFNQNTKTTRLMIQKPNIMNPIGINIASSSQSYVPGLSSHHADVNKRETYSQNTLRTLYRIPTTTFFTVIPPFHKCLKVILYNE